ncbi:MAG: 3-deoxy-D-manno-octulosonic acid transferase [bacterium]
MPGCAKPNLSLNLFILYQILLGPIIILILILSLFIKRIREGIIRRFSLSKINCLGEVVIIHSSSLGEAKVAVKLAVLIKEIKPDINIIGISFTTDGFNILNESKIFKKTFLYPIDIYPFFYLKMRKIEPIAVIFIEADLWPSIILWARRRGARIIIFSGRITKRAIRLMGTFRPIVSELYRNIDKIYASTELEYNKLLSLIKDEEKIVVSGNLKYLDIKRNKYEQNRTKNSIKKQLDITESDIIIVAGSTHNGEEEILINTYACLKKKYNNLRLIIAPRYKERSSEIYERFKSREYKIALYSHIVNNPNEWDILLIDKIGLLSDIYSIAHIAFIGGSLVKRGGQNILEPSRYSIPILFGPNVSNFDYEAKVLLSNSGGIVVRNISELNNTIAKLLDNESIYRRYSQGSQFSYKQLSFDKSLLIDEVKRWI